MNNTKLLDINEYMKERNVESIFDNESICKKFYPYVSECLRSPEGLKRIVSFFISVTCSYVLPVLRRILEFFKL